jgi:hypothetical protein
MRVVYILGLAHSGTTIIDRILSCYPGVIGLGEVEHIIRKIERQTIHNLSCPCGAKTAACPFWKEITTKRYDSPAAFFSEVVATAGKQGYSTVIDSSKSVGTSSQYSRMLARGEISDLAVLRIVRDPRGWVHSMARRENVELTDRPGLRALFDRWLLASLKLDAKVQRRKDNVCYVWYDKLILAREEAKLANLLGLPPTKDDEILLETANQHAIAGNKFAFSKKREKLTYDTRWLESPEIEEIYASIPALRSYYHELQTLHLNKAAPLPKLPSADAVAKLEKVVSEAGMSKAGVSASRSEFAAL